MEDINTFPFPKEWYQCLKFFEDDAQKSKEIMLLLDYIFDNLKEEETGILLTLAKPEIDRRKAKMKAGQKGGQLSKKPKKISKTQANDKQTISKVQAEVKQNVSKVEANSKQTISKTQAKVKQDFQTFCNAYGRAQNKNSNFEAWKHWEALSNNDHLPALADLLSKVEEYKQSLDPANPERFKEGIHTWLNKRRWQDEFTPYKNPDTPTYTPPKLFKNEYQDTKPAKMPDSVKQQMSSLIKKKELEKQARYAEIPF